MNRRLIIGLTLSAVWLYVASLFLPAADLSFNGMKIWQLDTVGELEQGWKGLAYCVFPLFWVALFPFVYLMVNVVFLLSVRRIGLHLDGRNGKLYPVLTSLSAVLSWFAPACVVGVGVGYFAWTAAITLVAVATRIFVNSDQSQVMLDSDGTDAASAV